MNTLTYQDALSFLFPRTTTIKFGLATTEALLDRLGRPDRVMPIIHIGGTNGKGSVSTLIASALREAGWRVGLYTSPHLISFRERIRVDDVPISEGALAMWTGELQSTIVAQEATFFEASTAIALADFAARGTEIAVVEVGLGGRLDSTNVVAPLVSVITKIEMDHQKYLGNTLDAIGREKAWIAKPGVPFIVGETRPEIVQVLREEGRRAVQSRDPAGRLDLRVVPAGYLWSATLGLVGSHQRRNAAVAHGALAALPAPYRPTRAQIGRGFARAFIPGRFDRRGKWLFDVAHNPDGMDALVAAIRASALPGPINALVSILSDKAWPEMLVKLDTVIDRGILTMAPTAEGRRWDPGWLRRWLKSSERPPARAAWSLVPNFHEALRQVQLDAGTVLVTGSFHTVGDVMLELGLGEVPSP